MFDQYKYQRIILMNFTQLLCTLKIYDAYDSNTIPVGVKARYNNKIFFLSIISPIISPLVCNW